MGGPPRGALPQRRRGGYSVSWSLVPLPRSSQAGVGVVPRCRATPASGCWRGRGPEAGPRGRTVQVGVALTRWRRGGPPAGPYGAETPARATARHGPARAKSTRAQVACDEPGRCVAGRGHGAARPGSGGPRSSRPGSAAAWASGHRGHRRWCCSAVLRCRVPGPCPGRGHLLSRGPVRGSVRTRAAPAPLPCGLGRESVPRRGSVPTHYRAGQDGRGGGPSSPSPRSLPRGREAPCVVRPGDVLPARAGAERLAVL